MLADKRILLGVSGGIAAYKAAELIRLLRAAGAQVRVVMTEAATAFITPLTLQALSGHPVHLELLDAEEESAMGHIALARWADLILIAPASADFLARLRLGLANDLLTAICLAAEVQIAVAPAMNHAMWSNPATQDNVECLLARGIRLLGPAEGEQACGESGPGRLLEPFIIRDVLATCFEAGALSGLSVLISAGPTREPIDPVRYISNRSSGKMGYALAVAAKAAGAEVTLVSGPVSLTKPAGIAVIDVETAAELYEAILARAPVCDIYIGAAAVADYTPEVLAEQKLKKQDKLTLTLSKTVDVLAAVAALQPKPYTVGFAAETQQVEAYARAKLGAKNLDMIAANRVGEARGGFDSDENALQIYWHDGEVELPMAPKTLIAHQLIDLISQRYRAQHST